MTTCPNGLLGPGDLEAHGSTETTTRPRHAHPLAAQVARIEKEQDDAGRVASCAGDT